MKKLLLPLFILLAVGTYAQTTTAFTFNDTLFKTAPGTAFFWSGRTAGKGGADIALAIAKKHGGITLEGLIEERGIKMPVWNSNDSSTIRPWQEASAAYARQVSGLVRAVVGDDLRPGNIWSQTELGKLVNNMNVTEIVVIDPSSEKAKVIFKR